MRLSVQKNCLPTTECVDQRQNQPLAHPIKSINFVSMNVKKITLWIDLFFCCVFLPLIITLVPVEKWIDKYTSFAITLIAFLYGVYFLIRYVNIPQLVMRRKYLHVLCVVALVIATTFALSQFPYPDNIKPVTTLRPNLNEHLRAQTVWFMSLVVCGYGLSISLLLELVRQIIVKKDIESQRDKAQMSLYKAQINPHFMFNTLNTLYGLTVSKSDNAEDAFIKFIEILKYTYTQVDADMIPVSDEIKYINDYIELQRLRLNSHTVVKWDYSIDDDMTLIPPMLLITFVENAFKYGCSSTRDCVIEIYAKLINEVLSFKVVNNIMIDTENDDISVGLNNCRARLALTYPDRYSLIINKKEGVYIVSLMIEL